MWKRVLAAVGIACLSVGCLFGCDNVSNTAGTYENTASPGAILPEKKKPVQTDTPDALKENVRMVRVDGELYKDTGKETEGGTCGVMDGTITSTVAEGKIPKKNYQSNFGKGYEYQYGAKDEISIVIDGKWIRFTKQKEKKN